MVATFRSFSCLSAMRLMVVASVACLSLLTFTGCNGSKAFVKRAAKMEEAGMMPQAADLYMTAVVKKPTNVDAVVGLKRTGQVVLAQHIAKFDEGVARNDRTLAIASWAACTMKYCCMKAATSGPMSGPPSSPKYQ